MTRYLRRRAILSLEIFFVCGFTLFPPAAISQWMISAYLGKSSTLPGDLTMRQPSQQNDLRFHRLHYANRSVEFPLYYGVRVAYFFSAAVPFGIEEEFIHAKVYSNPDEVVLVSGLHRGVPMNQSMRLGDVVQEFSISHGLNFLFTNLVVGFRVLDGRGMPFSPINLLLRVGIGPTIPHTETTIDSVHTEKYEMNGPAFQLAAGFQGYLFWRLNYLAEYKFTYTKLRDALIHEGTASAILRTHHVLIGLAVVL
jgi:lipid A oxidase